MKQSAPQTFEFIYEGVTPQGQRVKGLFRGERVKFLEEAHKRNLTILKVKRKKVRLGRGKFAEKDLHSGIEELQHLINSGMKIDQALQLLIRTSPKESVIAFWKSVLKEVKSGRQFSLAIKNVSIESKLTFPEFYTNLLSVGEEIGNLGAALVRLNDYLAFNRNLMAEIRSALAYPSFLLVMTVAALGLIFGLILPNFANIFGPKEMSKLPAVSRFVFELGRSVRENPTPILLALAALSLGVVLSFRWIKEKTVIILSALPVTRRLTLTMDLANVFASFGIMLEGGIDVARALKQTARVARLPHLCHLLEQSVDEIKKGRKISDIWADSRIIPPEVISLTIVGESTARMGPIMQGLGNRFLDSFKRDVKTLLTWLEPCIILILGLFVGFIVVAIALALVSINEIVA